MLKYYTFLSITIATLTMTSCGEKTNPNFQQEAANAEYLHKTMYGLTEVLVHDIFGAPIAARIYGYCNIAAYEAYVPGDSTRVSTAGQLNGLTNLPKPEAGKAYCYPLASVKAMLKTGRALVFSEDKIDALTTELLDEYKKMGIPKEVYERSIAFGDTIAGAVIAWSKKDNYAQTRSAAKYSVISDDPGRWRPTPPDYSDALEPHWNEIRPFVLDSASQFRPTPAPKFSKDKNSPLYKLAMEVYRVVKDSADFTLGLAKHFDDNAFATEHQGHVMMANKKFTPGGHWLNIGATVARNQKRSFAESVEMYMLVSVGLLDGFISCWDEKYRSNLLRPETYINENIDPEWRPTLQTPPFPEHTSGHSVISGASAEILTALLGDNVNFTDSTEIIFDLPLMSFASFRDAAHKSSDSRKYGGIHYRTGVEAGLVQGTQLGKYLIATLKTRK